MSLCAGQCRCCLRCGFQYQLCHGRSDSNPRPQVYICECKSTYVSGSVSMLWSSDLRRALCIFQLGAANTTDNGQLQWMRRVPRCAGE